MNKRITLLILLLLVSPVFGNWEALRGKSVVSIRSSYFGESELNKIASFLGISIGRRVDTLALDKRIRLLYQKGEVQSLLIRAEAEGSGISILLSGTRLREVNDVRFTNVSEEILRDLKSTISVKTGDPADFRSLSQLREQLISVYEDAGYYSADVQILTNDLSNGYQTDIEVVVTPNEPARIDEIRVVGAGDQENERIRELINLRSGVIYTRESIDKCVNEISQYLRDNQYLTSKVDETGVSFSSDKALADVTFFIRLGQRFQFEFLGNDVFYEPQLRELMTQEVLSQVNAAQRIAELVEQKYRSVGYHFVRVTVIENKNSEAAVRAIRFEIDEGNRVLIDKLEFEGEPRIVGPGGLLSEKYLRKLFFKSAPGVIRDKVYWESGLPDAIRNFEQQLVEFGYLGISVTIHKTLFKVDKLGVDISLDIKRGTRTVVSGVQLSGNRIFSASELGDLLPVESGEPYSETDVTESIQILTDYYRTKGYLDVKVSKKGGQSNALPIRGLENVLIELDIVEGIQYHVGDIVIEGNVKTRDEVIRRELRVAKGDVYNPNLIRASEEGIILLGLFSRVRVAPTVQKENKGVKGLKIVVTEVKPGSGEVGFGASYFDSSFRLIGFLGLGYRNVQGLNHTVTFRTDVFLPVDKKEFLDFVEYATLLSYRAPYPLGLPLSFTGQFGTDNFIIDRTGAKQFQERYRLGTRIEKQLTEDLLGIWRLFQLEYTITRKEDNGTGIEEKTFDRIGSIGPGLVVDLRDDIFNPKRGSYHTLDFEFAAPYLLSQDITKFVMLTLRNSFYVPVVGPFSFVGFVGGAYANSFNSGGIPTARLASEIALGGPGSIRGYSVRQFKSQEDKEVVQKAAFVNARLELWTKLASKLSMVTFFDTGQIYKELRPQGFKHGVGVGIRYETPVGPVAIDLGIGLDDKVARPYFTVGSL